MDWFEKLTEILKMAVPVALYLNIFSTSYPGP